MQWYKFLQRLNGIDASLQKLLSRNEQQKLSWKRAITQPKLADVYQYGNWPVFYSNKKFCKVWIQSMPPFKSYWVETKSVTMTPPPKTWTDNLIPMCLPCYAGDTKSVRWVANSTDSDQIPHSVGSYLVYTVCSGLSVPILRVYMVIDFVCLGWSFMASQCIRIILSVVISPTHTFPGQDESDTCAYTLVSNWQMPFLNQLTGEDGHSIHFIINFHQNYVAELGFEHVTPGSAVRPATNYAIKPSSHGSR